MQQEDNLLGVLRVLYRWRKYLIAIPLITALITAIIVLVLPVYYQAQTTFYAAHTDLASPERIFGTSTDAVDYYGERQDIDRVIAVAKSSEVVNYLVDKFKLYERYDIDTSNYKAPYYVTLKLFSLYKIQKNKFDALSLTVEDEDPDVAAQMANDARNKISEVTQRMIRESQQLVKNTLQSNIENKSEALRQLGDSLQAVRAKYNIYNSIQQSQALANQLDKTQRSLTFDSVGMIQYKKTNQMDSVRRITPRYEANSQVLSSLRGRLALFNQGQSLVEVLSDQQKEASEQLGEDRERLKLYETALQQEFTTIHLLEPASTPIIKSRPKRTLLVLAATLVAGVLTLLGILLIHTYKDLDWRSVIEK